MALVNCPDCNKQVSANAPTCPGCGAPIAAAKEAAGSGVQQLSTIQETSKRLKLHTLGAVAATVTGTTWLIVHAQSGSSASPAIPAILAFGGLSWYLVTRFRIWWHHK
jgi:hypothetical protein